MWLRRMHLYSGLFMMPWVLLYAVTGAMFNHHALLHDRPARTFGPEATAGTSLERPPDAEALAGEVATALRRRGHDVRVVDGRRAVYDYGAPVGGKVVAGEKAYHLRVFPSGSGHWTEYPEPPAGAAPFDAETDVFVDPPLAARVEQALPVVASRVGVPEGKVSVDDLPGLTFYAEANGRRWRVKYDPASGKVTSTPAEKPADKSAFRVMQEMHLSVGYPDRIGTRWFWAVAVDAMVLSMILWAVSGLFMWWQIKAVRAAGVVILLSSAALATVLAVGMHRAIAP